MSEKEQNRNKVAAEIQMRAEFVELKLNYY